MADPVPYVVLDPQVRGDEFSYTSGTIANSWVQSMFTGGVRMTFWEGDFPKSANVGDSSAIDQATTAAGDLTFPTTSTIKVLIPGARTTRWPSGKLVFDVQGVVTIGARVLTLCRGEVLILGDATRSQSSL